MPRLGPPKPASERTPAVILSTGRVRYRFPTGNATPFGPRPQHPRQPPAGQPPAAAPRGTATPCPRHGLAHDAPSQDPQLPQAQPPRRTPTSPRADTHFAAGGQPLRRTATSPRTAQADIHYGGPADSPFAAREGMGVPRIPCFSPRMTSIGEVWRDATRRPHRC